MIKAKYKWIFSLLIVLAVVIASSVLFCHQKKGFSISKIASHLEFSEKWIVDSPEKRQMNHLQTIFSQPFHYLGAGAQCYAFLSADGKYVLKFFKMKHLLPKKWLRYLPIPGLDRYRFNKIDKRIRKQEELFSSYTMAYQFLKEETGLVFVHLNKTSDLKMRVSLIDKKGITEQIDLDQFEFILQHKSQLFHDRIAQLMAEGNREGAKTTIRELFKQVVMRCKRGFIDQDSGIAHNYGFVNDQIIHFDVGRLVRDESAKNPSRYDQEILRATKKLEQWFSEFYPELLPDLKEIATDFKSTRVETDP